jgi:hypothetical protein
MKGTNTLYPRNTTYCNAQVFALKKYVLMPILMKIGTVKIKALAIVIQ